MNSKNQVMLCKTLMRTGFGNDFEILKGNEVIFIKSYCKVGLDEFQNIEEPCLRQTPFEKEV